MAMKKMIFFLLVVLSICFLTNELAAQCAMCRASVESNISTGKGTIGSGLNTGILYLMALPYLALGAIAYAWFVQYKKNKSKQALFAQLRKDS